MDDLGLANSLGTCMDSLEPLQLEHVPAFPDIDNLVMMTTQLLPLPLEDTLCDRWSGGAESYQEFEPDVMFKLEPKFSYSAEEVTPQPSEPILPPTTGRDGSQEISSYLQSLDFSTKELNLVPKAAWKGERVSFVDMCTNHFLCKSNRRVKFEHKLWNALQVTSLRPDLYPLVGVMWLSDSIIQVSRLTFGRLLGLEKSTSALFNMQGSFPTHGFDELGIEEVRKLAHVNSPSPDFGECRFFVRRDGKFSRFSKEDDVMACIYQKPNFGV